MPVSAGRLLLLTDRHIALLRVSAAANVILLDGLLFQVSIGASMTGNQVQHRADVHVMLETALVSAC